MPQLTARESKPHERQSHSWVPRAVLGLCDGQCSLQELLLPQSLATAPVRGSEALQRLEYVDMIRTCFLFDGPQGHCGYFDANTALVGLLASAAAEVTPVAPAAERRQYATQVCVLTRASTCACIVDKTFR